MANWIQVQAWYDTESGKYYMGNQPPTGNQQQTVAVGANTPQYLQTQPQQSANVPTQVAVGFQNGPRVRYNYQPQQYNAGVNYARPYAVRAPYAPNQPYYETVIGSDGQPRVIRLGEYQQMQPTHYETFYNSQGQLVQVPQYAPMNNSAAAVRTTDQIIGGSNQPVASSTTSSVATTPRVRSMPEPVPNQQYIEERNTTSNQRLTNEELNALTGTTTETTYSDPTTSLPVPSEVDPTTLAIYTERIRKEEESKANSLQNVVGASPEDVRTLTDEEILREALRRIKRDDEALREAEKNTSVQYVGI